MFTGVISDPGRVRTCNLRSRNPKFYPVELRSHAANVDKLYLKWNANVLSAFIIRFGH